MARNAVLRTAAPSFVLRYGNCDFSADGSFDAGSETQVALNVGEVPDPGFPLHHQTVTAGAFVVLSEADRNTVDAERPTDRVQRNNATAEATFSGSTFQSVIGGVWSPQALIAGEYNLLATFEMKLDTAATWGAGGPDKSCLVELRLNGNPIQQWLWPFDRYSGFSYNAGKPFAQGATPTFDLLARVLAAGSHDMQIRNVRLQLERADPPAFETGA